MAARRPYRMTAKRKISLKKAQLVSAKKRKRKTVLKTIAVGSAVAGSAVTARHLYNKQFTYLYHNTSNFAANKIVKEGFKESKANSFDGGRAFFHIGKYKNNQKYNYGPGTVKMRVPKKHLKIDSNGRFKGKWIRHDWNEFEMNGANAASIHPRAIKKAGYKITLGKPQRTKSMIRQKRWH